MADKKFLILYASAGHGHEKAAKAVEAVCRAHPGLTVECVDTLKRTSLGFGDFYRSSYLSLIRTMPWFWGLLYYVPDRALVYALVRPIRQLVNHFLAAGVEKLIADGEWDVVISTHFLATEVAGRLKRCGRTRAKLVTVITDFLPHTFWMTDHNDLYCVASEETEAELLRRGVPAEKLRVTGIPIEPKFSSAPSKEAARKSLSLDPLLFTVLLTSGGAGVVHLETIIDKLAIQEPPTQLLVVCGTNKAMRASLQAKHQDRTHIRVFGFIDNVQELMAACDLVVGKGGGLTISECLAVGRPMVLIGAVPGQETRNVRVVTQKGAASFAPSYGHASELISKYRADGAFYERTRQAVESIRRPDSAQAVLKAVLSL